MFIETGDVIVGDSAHELLEAFVPDDHVNRFRYKFYYDLSTPEDRRRCVRRLWLPRIISERALHELQIPFTVVEGWDTQSTYSDTMEFGKFR